MSAHSPEPWRLDDRGDVYDANGDAVWKNNGWGEQALFNDEVQLPRIVACVNACAGIPTEALEAGALGRALDLVLKGFIPSDPLDMCTGDEPDCLECQAVNLLRSLGRLT